MTTQTTARRPRRVATPARWQAALARAVANGVQVRQLADTGEWIATSGSDAGVCYRTDGADCECPAAQLGGDPVCQHRAMYWHAVGMLDLEPDPGPKPEPPAPVAAPDAGPSGVHGPYRVVCPGCGAVGFKLQDKPLPPGWRCHRCAPPPPRPGAPRPPIAPPLDLLADAVALAA